MDSARPKKYLRNDGKARSQISSTQGLNVHAINGDQACHRHKATFVRGYTSAELGSLTLLNIGQTEQGTDEGRLARASAAADANLREKPNFLSQQPCLDPNAHSPTHLFTSLNVTRDALEHIGQPSAVLEPQVTDLERTCGRKQAKHQANMSLREPGPSGCSLSL